VTVVRDATGPGWSWAGSLDVDRLVLAGHRRQHRRPSRSPARRIPL